MADNKAPGIDQGSSSSRQPWQGHDAQWLLTFLSMGAAATLFSIDLKVSRLFFTPDQGFFYAQNPWVVASYEWTPLLGRSVLLALLLVVLTKLFVARFIKSHPAWMPFKWLTRWNRTAVIALVCAALGPGLIVEGLFKRALCRPRPVQVIAFGGPLAHQTVPTIRTHAEPHRSFVSSHAAAGFWLMTLGLTAGIKWRRRWLAIGIFAGSVIGLGRILQGGHYFTDIIFAFYAVWISSEIVMRWERRQRFPQVPT